MEKILLDTNFLLLPAQFRIDIFSELRRICDFNYRIFILDKSFDELNKIAEEQRGRRKAEVKLTLDILRLKINNNEVKVIDTSDSDENVDDLIVSMDGYIIGTQDRGLQQRLKQKNARIISMRNQQYLFFK